MRVIARQGDTADALCYRHLGRTAGLLERVLEDNPGLAAQGAFIAEGTAVDLPDITANDNNPAAHPLIQLWD